MVKYHFFKTGKEAKKKAKKIWKRGHRATVFNFGNPSKKGYPWRVHEYKQRLPEHLIPKKKRRKR